MRNERGLRAGDWVEVKPAAEILATLDDQGRLESLPFMPEMLPHCGHRFQVFKSAHKTCDTTQNLGSLRSIPNAVHLVGVRCTGAAHGGCQAGCLLFWKEAWLKRVDQPSTSSGTSPRCDVETLTRATRVANGGDTEVRYRCQATELNAASTPLPWWNVRGYVRDLWSRNVRLGDFVRYVLIAAYNNLMRLHWRLRPYPSVRGVARDPTPTAVLDLKAGERVRVRSRDDIMRTLNAAARNRGLSFDPEMVPFCGKPFTVLRRVERIVNEKTGKMISIRGACLILDGAACGGCLSSKRLFCTRSIYPYWHEVWLERVAP
ncbi:MAG TPA: hypothetical protein VK124_08450 [Gemmatimonadales bacterium]|nr:hypothetical protein [Gemmatimonadales bacterium]